MTRPTTIAEAREDKAWRSGDYAAARRDREEKARDNARLAFLQENPDVGVLTRNGRPTLYRNLEPYRDGRVEVIDPTDYTPS